MPNFAYEARTEDGQLVGGVISAASAEEAGRRLSEQGQYIIKLGPAGMDGEGVPRAHCDGSRLKASRRHVMWFMNQLAIMIETGTTIGEALDVLARQAADPVMKEILTDVSTAVQEGRPLSDAMDAYPRTFPPVSTAMIRAGEASGTLSLILNRIADYLLKDQQAMARLRGALTYPAFMFVMCIAVTVFLLTVILPRFATIYSSKGAALPGPTRILMALSDGMVRYGPVVLAGAVVLGAGAVWCSRKPLGRRIMDGIQLRTPILGAVFAKLYQSRAFRALGTLLEAGVPIADTLNLAQNMTSNTYYRQLWMSVREGITNGERISTPMAESGMLPESVVHMVECGDRTGRLGFVFSRLADFLEQEYDRAVKVASQFVEPLMVLLMGGIIGFVAIAMLLPMFKIASVVAK